MLPFRELKEEELGKAKGGDRRTAKRKSISRWWVRISNAPEKLEKITGFNYITGDSGEVHVNTMMSSEAWGDNGFK